MAIGSFITVYWSIVWLGQNLFLLDRHMDYFLQVEAVMSKTTADIPIMDFLKNKSY